MNQQTFMLIKLSKKNIPRFQSAGHYLVYPLKEYQLDTQQSNILFEKSQ